MRLVWNMPASRQTGTELVCLLQCVRLARESGQSGTRSRQQPHPQLLQRPPAAKRRLSGAACQRVDLLQVTMVSQQAQCVRLVVDALLEGRFSKVSVVLHMYEALQALIHDPQVRPGSLRCHRQPHACVALTHIPAVQHKLCAWNDVLMTCLPAVWHHCRRLIRSTSAHAGGCSSTCP